MTLPAGLYDVLTDSMQRTAEVRELNGEDEEAILKAQGSMVKTLETILNRGVVEVAGKPFSEVSDDLLTGDRDWLILQIRRATFGDEIDFGTVQCPKCHTDQEVAIRCSTDIPVTQLDGSPHFELDLASGRKVKVSLPTGAVAKALASSADTSRGVLNTILLSKCVTEIDGTPVFQAAQVRTGLSWRDREAVLAEIEKRTPGPRLGEVTRPCTGCEEPLLFPLGLVGLFRL